MIYLDTSVLLAQILVEDRKPPDWLWQEDLISSRLIEYETWTWLNARNLAESHGDAAQALIGRTALLELSAPVLARTLDAFPVPVRTLDALHLASIHYLVSNGQSIKVASFDRRMVAAATALGFDIADLAKE